MCRDGTVNIQIMHFSNGGYCAGCTSCHEGNMVNTHDIRVWVDDEVFADMEEVRALLTRELKQKPSNRIIIKVALKFLMEGHRNGSLRPFLTRMRIESRPPYEKI